MRQSIAQSMSDSFVSGTASIDPYVTAQIPIFASDMGASTAMAAVSSQIYDQQQVQEAEEFAEAPEFASIFEPDDDEDQVLPPVRGRILGLAGIAALLAVIIWFTVPSVQSVFSAGPGQGSSQSQAKGKPAAGPPQIASITYLDPDGTPGPSVDPGLAIDGDVKTAWQSFSYPTADLTEQGPFGLVLSLKAPATLNEVDLVVYGTGGTVEILDKAPTAKGEATTPLASGPMSVQTKLKLAQPATVSTVVVWFTALPKAEADGAYWIDLGEISLS